jgi:SAM-dependent methyltransferase
VGRPLRLRAGSQPAQPNVLPSSLQVQPGFASFRDPDGSVFTAGGRLFRSTTAAAAATLQAVLATPAAQRLLAAGRLVRTTALPDAGRPNLFEHERIPFPSYPYEWPPEMLAAAAALTLDLARELLPAFSLKDASPYNILFRGPDPVFVDVLSFEPRDPHDPIWLPYAQFVRTFLLPLALNTRLGLPLDQMLLTRRDGLDPEEVYRWLPLSRRLRPPFLSLVTFPFWLARRRQPSTLYRRRAIADPEKALFILQSLLDRLARTLRRLQPPPQRSSPWSGYAEANSYPPSAAAQKAAFIENALRQYRPRRVLDLGSNTGRFSELAAAHGASVVAIDRDPVVVGALWSRARAAKLDILPLVVDITRPTPAAGWRNAECPSFLARAQGSFDAVWMLALLHHLAITERIPLPQILDLAAHLTTNLLLVEFIGPRDPMFQTLLRGREALYEHFTEPAFQSAAAPHFDLLATQPLQPLDRTLYLFRKRAAADAAPISNSRG